MAKQATNVKILSDRLIEITYKCPYCKEIVYDEIPEGMIGHKDITECLNCGKDIILNLIKF